MAKQSALGSRPASSEKRFVGIVVATIGEKKAKFTLVEGQEKKFKGEKESLVVSLDSLPELPHLTQEHTGKQFRIRLNTDGDEVEAIMPVVGHYQARLIDLGPRKEKDGDPEPFEKEFTRGEDSNSHLEFFAVYKVVKGMYKGVQMPGYYMHYKFENDGSGNTRYAGNFDNKKATRLFQLKSWMELHRLEDEPIEWDDVTILPTLLERALESDVKVELIVKDGYIREVLPVQDDDEADETPKRPVKEVKQEMGFEDEVDEAFPKPKAKKVAKKVEEETDEDEL